MTSLSGHFSVWFDQSYVKKFRLGGQVGRRTLSLQHLPLAKGNCNRMLE